MLIRNLIQAVGKMFVTGAKKIIFIWNKMWYAIKDINREFYKSEVMNYGK